MRILAIEDHVTSFRGGSERSYFDVLTGLQSAGHEVSMIYSEEGNLLESYTRSGVKTYKRSHSLLMRGGSKVADFRAIWNTVTFIKKEIKPDVVYLNFTEAIPLAALIRMRLGIPVVCHIRIGYFGLSRQILWCGKLVAAFIVINKKFKPVFENAFKAPGKFSVVYNGITIPSSMPSIKRRNAGDPLRVLYLGRIANDKGVIEMVRSFSAAVKNGVKGSLHITGSFVASYLGDFRKELTDIIDQSGAAEFISIDEPVTNPVEHISKFDLLIFPSTWDEGFGRTVPESIVAGTPVLARNVGMINEMMVDNPQFVFDTDEQMADKITSFYNGDLQFDFESARLRVIKDFNKIRMVSEVEKILLDVVRK